MTHQVVRELISHLAELRAVVRVDAKAKLSSVAQALPGHDPRQQRKIEMNDDVLIPGGHSQLSADLSLESERLRLGPAGFKGFFAIGAKWNLADDQARQLLDLEPEDELDQVKTHPDPRLFTEERLMRIGCVIGIHRGLHTCFGDNIADAWMSRPNLDSIFGGQSPVEYMIRGGLDAMYTVRRQTDAWSVGNF